MSSMENLAAEVASTVTLEESTLKIVDAIGARITQAGNDEVALQALVDELTAERAKLSAAVIANTPADPNPQPEPAVNANGDTTQSSVTLPGDTAPLDPGTDAAMPPSDTPVA
jgi:hypothetical protein